MAWLGALAAAEKEETPRVNTQQSHHIWVVLHQPNGGRSCVCAALPLMVGDGVDGLELDGVLRLVHTELTAAFLSAVL